MNSRIFCLVLAFIISTVFVSVAHAAEGDVLWATSSPAVDLDTYNEPTSIFTVGTSTFIFGFQQGYNKSGVWQGNTNRLEKRNSVTGALLKSIILGSPRAVIPDGMVADGTGVYTSAGGVSNGYLATYLQKRNPTDFSLIWSQVSGWEGGGAVYPTISPNGSLYWLGCGYTASTTGLSYYPIVQKMSTSTGTVTWLASSSPIQGSASGCFTQIPNATVTSEGIYIAGTAGSGIKLYSKNVSDGSPRWDIMIPHPEPANASSGLEARGVAVDSTGIYVLISPYTYPSSGYRGYVQKRSSVDGSLVWQQQLDFSVHAQVGTRADRAMVITPSGSLYVVGIDSSGGAVLAKINTSNGTILFEKTEYPANTSSFYPYSIYADDTYLMLGLSSTYGDPSLQWSIERRDTNPSSDIDTGLRVKETGGVFAIAGSSTLSASKVHLSVASSRILAVLLVSPGDSLATHTHIKLPDGTIMALKKYVKNY
jgi:hypothetical protein